MYKMFPISTVCQDVHKNLNNKQKNIIIVIFRIWENII